MQSLKEYKVYFIVLAVIIVGILVSSVTGVPILNFIGDKIGDWFGGDAEEIADWILFGAIVLVGLFGFGVLVYMAASAVISNIKDK